ncbi:hypothetical protein TNCV_227361 [Trichonephila clavipes]|nr:hypothetical protein TNCV_227361 [Trichonephila clavipes]
MNPGCRLSTLDNIHSGKRNSGHVIASEGRQVRTRIETGGAVEISRSNRGKWWQSMANRVLVEQAENNW